MDTTCLYPLVTSVDVASETLIRVQPNVSSYAATETLFDDGTGSVTSADLFAGTH